jgi:hypothetical protein
MEELNDKQKEVYEEERVRLIGIIESFDSLSKTKEWELLNELVFNPSRVSIEKQLLNETLSPVIDINKLYKLQGEWSWVKKYTDTKEYVETLKKQLLAIKSKLL